MEKIRTLIREHKTVALVCLFLLIVFIGGSAMSAVNVAQMRAQQETPQAEEQESGGGQLDSGSPAQEESENVALTDAQSAAIDSYDGDTTDYIGTLSASVWSANGGRYTLRFYTDNQYTETVDGESTQHSYAILRLESGTDDAGSETVTAVVETDTGTHILSYSNLTGTAADGSDKVTSTLSSGSMFALKNASYERADAVENISVKGLNSAVTSLIGGSPDELTAELSRWCAVHYPTATEATWNQVASIDWENGVVTTGFSLNGESTVNLTVIYNMDTGAFEFGY